MLTTNGTHTLVNIITMDPISENFASQIAFSQGVATMIIIQAKVMSYHDQYFEDDFIPLVVGIFGCLRKQMNDLFHQCANMA